MTRTRCWCAYVNIVIKFPVDIKTFLRHNNTSDHPLLTYFRIATTDFV